MKRNLCNKEFKEFFVLPDMSDFYPLHLALEQKHHNHSWWHWWLLFGWGERSDFQTLSCYWPESSYTVNNQDEDIANMNINHKSTKHLQLFCPWEIHTSPLFVTRTIKVVNINNLGDVWLPFHRTREDIKPIYSREWNWWCTVIFLGSWLIT